VDVKGLTVIIASQSKHKSKPPQFHKVWPSSCNANARYT